jgi:Bacterial PH domain
VRVPRGVCLRFRLSPVIESIDVDQSIMGRALNYGDVTISGTGQTFEPLRQVDHPVAFRNEVTAR